MMCVKWTRRLDNPHLVPHCAAEMESILDNPLESIKRFLVTLDTTLLDDKQAVVRSSCSLLPIRLLRSDRAADSRLKVRPVLEGRVLQRANDLRSGYGTSFPLSVRLETDGTYTVFDGNHRYHAIRYLIDKGGDHCKYDANTHVPCVIYNHTLPDRLAMAYAQILNDLQLCASGATPLDFLRFVKNHMEREEVKNEGEAKTANYLFVSMQRFFDSSSVVVPRARESYIKACITFLNQLGDEAFDEAERLMAYNPSTLYTTIKAVLAEEALHGCSLPVHSKDAGNFVAPRRCCFLPESAFIFHGCSFGKELSVHRHPTGGPEGVKPGVMWVRALWTHWIVTGGTTVTAKEAAAIKTGIVRDLANWTGTHTPMSTALVVASPGMAEEKVERPCDSLDELVTWPPTYVAFHNTLNLGPPVQGPRCLLSADLRQNTSPVAFGAPSPDHGVHLNSQRRHKAGRLSKFPSAKQRAGARPPGGCLEHIHQRSALVAREPRRAAYDGGGLVFPGHSIQAGQAR